MKRIIFFIIVIFMFIFLYINVNASEDDIVIPDAAIRVRVIANSNSIYDQSMKMKVKSYIEKNLSVKLLDVDNVDDARNIIKDNLDSFNQDIKEIFDDNDYHYDFVVHFGDNYFPSKEYKGVSYKAGNYESLVVTIGDGNGDNWWCVLFPPLCLLEGEKTDTSDVEYQFFIEKIIRKYFE